MQHLLNTVLKELRSASATIAQVVSMTPITDKQVSQIFNTYSIELIKKDESKIFTTDNQTRLQTFMTTANSIKVKERINAAILGTWKPTPLTYEGFFAFLVKMSQMALYWELLLEYYRLRKIQLDIITKNSTSENVEAQKNMSLATFFSDLGERDCTSVSDEIVDEMISKKNPSEINELIAKANEGATSSDKLLSVLANTNLNLQPDSGGYSSKIKAAIEYTAAAKAIKEKFIRSLLESKSSDYKLLLEKVLSYQSLILNPANTGRTGMVV